MGRVELRPIVWKINGPDRAAAHHVKILMGRPGPRPIHSKFNGPGRATAYAMWALHGPLCRAHEAAHEFSQASPGRGP